MYAAHASGFENAVCCIVDGAGEAESSSFFIWEKGELSNLSCQRSNANRYSSMASLGFYFGMTVCDLCGFEMMSGEEWKIMGLAPYGKLDEELLEILEAHLYVDGLDLVMDDGVAPAFTDIVARRRNADQDYLDVADLAFTGQHHFENLLFQILNHLYTLAPNDDLILSGGCALNSSANGKILANTPFKRLFIPCAPGDDGNAIGAALLAFADDGRKLDGGRSSASPYTGSEIPAAEIENLFDNCSIENRYRLEDDQLFETIAHQLADGMIVGWVQGRAEFGPRALGNRSILASPRIESIRDKINAVVKYREWFRPLAPSVLHEMADEYFQDYHFSPYMERTLLIREEKRNEIPAVCHVDGTGRLQSVTEQSNPRYHGLLRAFHQLTGTPILVNTSFNVMGKPIVHDAADALVVFMSTGMDVVVLGNHVFSKKPLF